MRTGAFFYLYSLASTYAENFTVTKMSRQLPWLNGFLKFCKFLIFLPTNNAILNSWSYQSQTELNFRISLDININFPFSKSL